MALEFTNKRPAANPLRKLVSTLRGANARHVERHTPSGFGFAFADRIDYLDSARWDGVVDGQSIFMRRAMLRHIEQNGPDNIQPRYAMIFRDREPVAAIAAQIVSVSGDRLRKETVEEKSGRLKLLKKAAQPAKAKAVQNLRENVLVAGNVLSWGFHGIAFAKGSDQAELWPGVADALYRLRRAHKIHGQTDFVMVKDVTAGQSGLKRLERWSYRSMETEPNMVLNIDATWRGYEDYLAALDAKYRRNAKDQLKKLTNAGCVVEPLANLQNCSGRLHELYLNVIKNAAVRLVTLPESYLAGLETALGPDFACNIIRRGEEILGFVTALRDGDTAIGYYIGYDREAAADGLPIYLRLLHSTIGDAIRWRCKRLSLGRTALEPKAALGAKPEPMSVYIRHRFPLMNWLLRGVMGAVPHAEAPERSPFKASTATAEV
jgi:hypothetical protein